MMMLLFETIGHNILSKTVPQLFKEAGLSGNYTNHSMRAIAAAVKQVLMSNGYLALQELDHTKGSA